LFQHPEKVIRWLGVLLGITPFTPYDIGKLIYEERMKRIKMHFLILLKIFSGIGAFAHYETMFHSRNISNSGLLQKRKMACLWSKGLRYPNTI